MGVQKDWSKVRAGLLPAIHEAMKFVSEGPSESHALEVVFEAVRKGQPELIGHYLGTLVQVTEDGDEPEDQPGVEYIPAEIAAFGTCLMAIYHASLSANQSLVVV